MCKINSWTHNSSTYLTACFFSYRIKWWGRYAAMATLQNAFSPMRHSLFLSPPPPGALWMRRPQRLRWSCWAATRRLGTRGRGSKSRRGCCRTGCCGKRRSARRWPSPPASLPAYPTAAGGCAYGSMPHLVRLAIDAGTLTRLRIHKAATARRQCRWGILRSLLLLRSLFSNFHSPHLLRVRGGG